MQKVNVEGMDIEVDVDDAGQLAVYKDGVFKGSILLAEPQVATSKLKEELEARPSPMSREVVDRSQDELEGPVALG